MQIFFKDKGKREQAIRAICEVINDALKETNNNKDIFSNDEIEKFIKDDKAIDYYEKANKDETFNNKISKITENYKIKNNPNYGENIHIREVYNLIAYKIDDIDYCKKMYNRSYNSETSKSVCYELLDTYKDKFSNNMFPTNFDEIEKLTEKDFIAQSIGFGLYGNIDKNIKYKPFSIHLNNVKMLYENSNIPTNIENFRKNPFSFLMPFRNFSADQMLIISSYSHRIFSKLSLILNSRPMTDELRKSFDVYLNTLTTIGIDFAANIKIRKLLDKLPKDKMDVFYNYKFVKKEKEGNNIVEKEVNIEEIIEYFDDPKYESKNFDNSEYSIVELSNEVKKEIETWKDASNKYADIFDKIIN